MALEFKARSGASLPSQLVCCRVEIPADAVEGGMCMSHIITEKLRERLASPIRGISEVPAT